MEQYCITLVTNQKLVLSSVHLCQFNIGHCFYQLCNRLNTFRSPILIKENESNGHCNLNMGF